MPLVPRESLNPIMTGTFLVTNLWEYQYDGPVEAGAVEQIARNGSIRPRRNCAHEGCNRVEPAGCQGDGHEMVGQTPPPAQT